MSYENTVCPCGGHKQTGAMLCDECETAFAGHPSMLVFKDRNCSVETRRHAAITLCALARGRTRRLQ